MNCLFKICMSYAAQCSETQRIQEGFLKDLVRGSSHQKISLMMQCEVDVVFSGDVWRKTKKFQRCLFFLLAQLN